MKTDGLTGEFTKAKKLYDDEAEKAQARADRADTDKGLDKILAQANFDLANTVTSLMFYNYGIRHMIVRLDRETITQEQTSIGFELNTQEMPSKVAQNEMLKSLGNFLKDLIEHCPENETIAINPYSTNCIAVMQYEPVVLAQALERLAGQKFPSNDDAYQKIKKVADLLMRAVDYVPAFELN